MPVQISRSPGRQECSTAEIRLIKENFKKSLDVLRGHVALDIMGRGKDVPTLAAGLP